MTSEDAGFLSRWSRRKEQSKRGEVAEQRDVAAEAAPALPLANQQSSNGLVIPQVGPLVPDSSPATEPLPTMADVARLSRESDFSRFVAPGVDDSVKHAAMKKLFSDPHFNLMDGLDTYIDDYGKPDPIPLAMLRKMTQSKTLRLFEDEEEELEKMELPATSGASTADIAPKSDAKHDDDADLQLQQDHAAGWTGPGEGTGT